MPDGNQLIIGGINRTKLYELVYFEKKTFSKWILRNNNNNNELSLHFALE